MTKLLFGDDTYTIIGICMMVHSSLGPGFLEAVYQEVLESELARRSIPHERNVKLDIFYNGEKLSKFYIADFVCYKKIILEIKSKEITSSEQERQLLNYLKATNFRLGLLINFGTPSLEFRRVIN